MRLAELAPRAERLSAQRVPYVEAIVVRAQRPTSVRPGDAAIVHADGTIDGFVGGVCAETTVRLHSLRVLETGEALLLQLRPGEESTEGVEDDARDGVITAHNPCLSGGEMEIFLEPCLPLPLLVITGDAPIADALRDLAPRVGFHVTEAEGDLDPTAAAVVVAAHGRDEEDLLTAALEQGVPYVALVASRARADSVRAALAVAGELRAQLHSPAGLDIGARTPAEIALAILAEIVGERARAPVPAAPAPAVAADPVCGMEVPVGPQSLHLELDGERHWFCSEGCRDRFAAEHAVHG
ncbi:MAG TPA: XdhC family protein [Solirubrobacteraceae bacterium]|nr:XdhC family protein [Solirubrobacteraceae bacterium]